MIMKMKKKEEEGLINHFYKLHHPNLLRDFLCQISMLLQEMHIRKEQWQRLNESTIVGRLVKDYNANASIGPNQRPKSMVKHMGHVLQCWAQRVRQTGPMIFLDGL